MSASPRLLLSALGAWSILAISACAGVRPHATGAESGTGGVIVTASSGGQSGSLDPGTGGGLGTDGSPLGVADARPQRCDDAGNCACMNILSLGKVAHYGGNSDSTDAFQQYLNTKSNAHMTLATDRITLTPELLAGYDVVILQALEDSEYTGFWSYGQDEIDALAAWVRAGNGLIALTGYGGTADEVDPSNQLLAFPGSATERATPSCRASTTIVTAPTR